MMGVLLLIHIQVWSTIFQLVLVVFRKTTDLPREV